MIVSFMSYLNWSSRGRGRKREHLFNIVFVNNIHPAHNRHTIRSSVENNKTERNLDYWFISGIKAKSNNQKGSRGKNLFQSTSQFKFPFPRFLHGN